MIGLKMGPHIRLVGTLKSALITVIVSFLVGWHMYAHHVAVDTFQGFTTLITDITDIGVISLIRFNAQMMMMSFKVLLEDRICLECAIALWTLSKVQVFYMSFPLFHFIKCDTAYVTFPRMKISDVSVHLSF